MARYGFEREESAQVKSNAGLTGTSSHTMTGINATLESADSVVSAMSKVYGVVGWDFYADTAVRTVKEDVYEE